MLTMIQYRFGTISSSRAIQIHTFFNRYVIHQHSQRNHINSQLWTWRIHQKFSAIHMRNQLIPIMNLCDSSENVGVSHTYYIMYELYRSRKWNNSESIRNHGKHIFQLFQRYSFISPSISVDSKILWWITRNLLFNYFSI